MNISAVSDQDLSRWYAEQMEPQPQKPPDWSRHVSLVGWWIAKFEGFRPMIYPPNQEGYPEAQYVWQHRNLTAPEMTVRLLFILLGDFHLLTLSLNFGDGDCGICLGQSEDIHWGADLPRTVLEAACLAKGWPGEGARK